MVRMRFIGCVLAVLTFVHILLLLLLHQQKVKHIRKKEKVHLLIISTWRSSSSLVGQFFSQHPDVFYLMEPAWHVWKAKPYSSGRDLHMPVIDLIRSIFKCDMSTFDTYVTNMNVSDLFLWYNNRALCTPPACNYLSHDKYVNVTACRQLCGNDSITKTEEACNTYSHIVVKEVRIFDLSVIYPLLKDPSLNLKILHLVRDPRAVAKSRNQTFRALAVDNGHVLNMKGRKINDTQFLVLREICLSHANMYKMATKDPPTFLNGRYMMVRYEDLVQDPLGKVQEMYKFVNLEMTEQVSEWISNVTHGQGLPTRKEAFEINSRDALNVSQAWRTVLPFQNVLQIQDVCKDAMNTFQYQFMKSESQQRDLSLDFILPRTKH